jgi:hypothetical protein
MTERDPGEIRAEEEAEAAAQEAANIGGPVPDPDVDPAERPLREAGEGESDGFEMAEEGLIEHATHGDAGGNPLQDEFTPEAERSGAAYGDADEVPSDVADEAGEEQL